MGQQVCWQAVCCTRSTPPSLSLCFQFQGASVQPRLLQRQELVVFGSHCAGAQPLPPPLPSIVPVGYVRAGRDVGYDVPNQYPYPCHPSCLYTTSGREGMLTGRVPLLLNEHHSIWVCRLRERAYSSAFLNGRCWWSLIASVPVPSQCSYPCHPSCL